VDRCRAEPLREVLSVTRQSAAGERRGIVSELHQAALDYYHQGWSVVPVAVAGKRALVPWKVWQHSRPDPDQLAAWWRRWPAANLAVVTGRVSGLVVVDVDVRHGGDRTLAELEAEHGDLPMLAMVETPQAASTVT
jgi:Bifunctional DNA primase/polymerase, N-terminal